MTVYVDDMQRRAKVGRLDAVWSHLFADTHEELIEFGALIGMRPVWLQHTGTHREHFDVTQARRLQALDLGAVGIQYPRGTADLMARKRKADPPLVPCATDETEEA